MYENVELWDSSLFSLSQLSILTILEISLADDIDLLYHYNFWWKSMYKSQSIRMTQINVILICFTVKTVCNSTVKCVRIYMSFYAYLLKYACQYL